MSFINVKAKRLLDWPVCRALAVVSKYLQENGGGGENRGCSVKLFGFPAQRQERGHKVVERTKTICKLSWWTLACITANTTSMRHHLQPHHKDKLHSSDNSLEVICGKASASSQWTFLLPKTWQGQVFENLNTLEPKYDILTLTSALGKSLRSPPEGWES